MWRKKIDENSLFWNQNKELIYKVVSAKSTQLKLNLKNKFLRREIDAYGFRTRNGFLFLHKVSDLHQIHW